MLTVAEGSRAGRVAEVFADLFRPVRRACSATPSSVQKDRSQARGAAAPRDLAPWRLPSRRPDSRRRRAASLAPETDSGPARLGRLAASREGRAYGRRTPCAGSERRLVGPRVRARAVSSFSLSTPSSCATTTIRASSRFAGRSACRLVSISRNVMLGCLGDLCG
jgi:hypothetical protein